jgi:hypothetical protein
MARSRVDLFEQIRRDRRVEKLSIRELAERYRVHRRTVRQALASAMPQPRKAYARRTRPAMDPWVEVIDSWLLGDRDVPRKQRHTARRVWQRLVAEHGAQVAEVTVSRYVARRRVELGLDHVQVSVPQTHPPGAEAEVDFGEFYATIAGTLIKLWMFVMRLSGCVALGQRVGVGPPPRPATGPSETVGKFGERDADAIVCGNAGREFIVAAAQVLHEGVAAGHRSRGSQAFESTHRPQPGFEPAVVGFDDVVGVPLENVPSTRRELVDDPRIDRRPVGRDLDRSRSERQRAGERRPRGRTVAALRQQHVDDLPVLIDGPVQVTPAASDLDVSVQPTTDHRWRDESVEQRR